MAYYRLLLRSIEVLSIIVSIVSAFCDDFTISEKINGALICSIMIIFVEAMMYITRDED